MKQAAWPKLGKLADGRFRVDTGRRRYPKGSSIVETKSQAGELCAECQREMVEGCRNAPIERRDSLDANAAIALLRYKKIPERLTGAANFFIAHRYLCMAPAAR